jgi:hypothetical protein
VLHPVEAHIQAAPDGSGWVARGESRFALRFHYVVVDARTGTKVLENEASLVCADAPVGETSLAAACTGGSADRPADAPSPPPEGLAKLPSDPKPILWSAALDIPAPWTTTFVASVLVRTVRDVVFPDGTRGSQIYGSQSAGVYGGSTLGFTYQRGLLVVPARLTLAADSNLFAVSGLAGLGVATSFDNTTLMAAPVVRFTSLVDPTPGSFSAFEPAMLFGARQRLWKRGCNAGWDLFAEVGVPLGVTGAWLASAGITQSWGPGSHYYFGGCSTKKRR